MSQIFIQPTAWSNSTFTADGSEAHHLVRVLRKKVGDEIEIFDGAGRRAEAKITHIHDSPARVEGTVLKEFPVEAKKVRINLFQGIPHGSKMDYVLEKATELGVDSIVPFLSKKSLIKLSPVQAEAKAKRWNAIVKAAAKQCDRADIPLVETPRPLLEWRDRLTHGQTILFWENETDMPLKSYLGEEPTSPTVNIVIGPESGFELLEVKALLDLGAKSVSLGRRILRTETAGLVVLSILNHAWNLF